MEGEKTDPVKAEEEEAAAAAVPLLKQFSILNRLEFLSYFKTTRFHTMFSAQRMRDLKRGFSM